ncbi:MAG: DoxX family protein [Porticoccaceae bacterium]
MNNHSSEPGASFHKFGPLVGRILLAALFIPAGVSKITGFATMAGMMADKGLAMVGLLLVLTIAIEAGGGLMLLLGWHARSAATVICLFLIPVTIVFHGFWGIEDAQAQHMQQIMFMKNVAIMGGLIFVAAFGSGTFSLSDSGRQRSSLQSPSGPANAGSALHPPGIPTDP